MVKKLKKLFNPQSIAIVGASKTEGKIGNIICRNLLEFGYAGEVFFVNPKHQKLFNKKCYRSLNKIKRSVDLAIIAVPAEFVSEIITNTKLIKNFVIISAGFSEIGESGDRLEKKLAKIAVENNLNILGPNCLGFINPKMKLNASFAGGLPEEGNVALISQSGALAVAMMDKSSTENISFSKIISIGNKMQIDEIDLMNYLTEDKSTEVIALYLEGIKNGQRFIEIAKKVSQKKPIIVLKSGQSKKAQEAISSHTGVLAGSNKIVKVAFKKAGILQADSLEEFFNLIKMVRYLKRSTKNNFQTRNIALVTNAGGPGVLATDSFANKKVSLIDISQKIKNELQKVLPVEASLNNPVDLLGDAKQNHYLETLRILDKHSDTDTIICIATAQEQTPIEEIAKIIVNFDRESSKNVIPVFIGGSKIKSALRILQKNNIPNFSFPKQVIDALEKIYKYKIAISKIDVLDNVTHDKKSKEKLGKKITKIIEKVRHSKQKALAFIDAVEIMKIYNIPTVNFRNINKKNFPIFDDENNNGKPIIAKIDSTKILHKTDNQGVILNINSQRRLNEAIISLRNNFPNEDIIIQPMIDSQAELILGIKNDSIFGPVIVYGLGGIYTEVFKMIDFLIPPITKDEVKRSIANSKIGFLFRKTRGKKIGDIDEFAEILFNFSNLAQDLSGIISGVDINPLLVDKQGKFIAVDIKIIV